MNADDVLRRYQDLPDFAGTDLSDVNQPGAFGDAPIHVAANRGRTDEITALLDGGADANAPGELGNTPLHEAVMQNRIEAVKLLLERGADPQRKNHFGGSPLDAARSRQNRRLVRLLEGGAPARR
ncbi:ankyrin repeat domain-containing protein [Inquilinus sp. YAF38]|uniref:ankyrin repeat domain-containing protein n=1 Tax=Inquilinus sp. YAF38 TaxID=3233084 RepID=UPI003F8F14EE